MFVTTIYACMVYIYVIYINTFGFAGGHSSVFYIIYDRNKLKCITLHCILFVWLW